MDSYGRGAGGEDRKDGTIKRLHGGYSSEAERLTVAQDVVGSIPTSRPNTNYFKINNLQNRVQNCASSVLVFSGFTTQST